MCKTREKERDRERKNFTYLLGRPFTITDVLARLEPLQDRGSSGLVLLHFLHLQGLATAAGLLVQGLERLLDELDILDTQLLADDGQIANGIDITLDVNDLGIVEAADDLEDGVDGTNVRQEGVTQTRTRGSTAGQTGNIVHGQVGGHLGLGLVVVTEPVEALVGNDDAGLLGVNGGIGEVGRVTQRRLGDGLE